MRRRCGWTHGKCGNRRTHEAERFGSSGTGHNQRGCAVIEKGSPSIAGINPGPPQFKKEVVGMLDIEKFSELCWCGEHPRIWNKRTGRGILYRGYSRILDLTAPFQSKLVVEADIGGRGLTWGT